MKERNSNLTEKETTGARVTAADTSSYCTESDRHAQLQHKWSAADMPSYGTEGGLPILSGYGTNEGMPTCPVTVRGGLPICPVTVQTEGCRYAQLRYKGMASNMPGYGTNGGMQICPVTVEGGLPICPVTVLTEGCRYAQLQRTGTAVYMPIYSTHGRQPICSDMRGAIDRFSYCVGRGADMTGQVQMKGSRHVQLRKRWGPADMPSS